MRMDNETFRLKVENLFRSVRSSDGELDREVMAQLERLASAPRKTRYFLKSLSEQEDEELQERFYRWVFAGVKSDQEAGDIERHIRHMFYQDREGAKAMLAKVADARALPALFRVIALTEEGWLAGELIRIVLEVPADVLYQPLSDALQSEEYLIQCLAIYLIGKAKDDRLLDLLARFYRKPVGEKIDRLERKSLDALLEGAQAASDDLILKWMKDKSARVRSLAIRLVQERGMATAAGDLTSLVLVDPRTRVQAAETLLAFARDESLRFDPKDPSADGIRQLMAKAKQEALQGTLQNLMRDESAAVREVAVNFVGFLREPQSVTGHVRRLAVEERSTAVQLAAIAALLAFDREKLVPVLVEVFTDSALASAPGREVIAAATRIMENDLTEEQVRSVQEGIKAKEERLEAALDRFAGSVEWWRHDL